MRRKPKHKPESTSSGQRGLTLIELLLAVTVSAIVLAALNGLVKLGLDAQVAGRGSNELSYQARFALERITDKANATKPKLLATPAANTTGDWFAPAGCIGAACVMYCRNASTSQLIETTTADSACTGTLLGMVVIASNVSAFSATLPATMGALDRSVAVLSLSLINAGNAGNALTLSSSVRLGGGAQ